jgi:hypothetical protein
MVLKRDETMRTAPKTSQFAIFNRNPKPGESVETPEFAGIHIGSLP